MNLSLMLTLILIMLLIITNIYAVLLNHRLKKLRNYRKDLKVLTEQFTLSTQQTEDLVLYLKTKGGSLEANLKTQVSKAEALYNELRFLVDRGETIANQLEQHIEASRTLQQKPLEAPRDPKDAILKAIKEMR